MITGADGFVTCIYTICSTAQQSVFVWIRTPMCSSSDSDICISDSLSTFVLEKKSKKPSVFFSNERLLL